MAMAAVSSCATAQDLKAEVKPQDTMVQNQFENKSNFHVCYTADVTKTAKPVS